MVFLYLMLPCVFVTFPYSVLCQVWYLTVSISDPCLLPYFEYSTCSSYRFVIFIKNDSSFTISNVISFFFFFFALRSKSTDIVMAGRSVHLATLFPGQA